MPSPQQPTLPFQDRIQAASAIIDSTNPDLGRFFARGGRLIIKAQRYVGGDPKSAGSFRCVGG